MNDIEISTDGRTVWINKTGCMIGRFSAKGIDIHHDFEGQMRDEHCLFCKQPPMPVKDWIRPRRSEWKLFIQKMKELHNVDVDPKLLTEFCS